MGNTTILFRVDGGLGKQIMSTAVLKAVKEATPEVRLLVQASCKSLFYGLSFVDKLYDISDGTRAFYEDSKNAVLLDVEPYSAIEFRHGKVHLVDVWCRMVGVEPIGHSGEIKLDEAEIRYAQSLLGRMGVQKPLIAFQPFGGQLQKSATCSNRIEQRRSLPQSIAQIIVSKLVKSGFNVLQISLPCEPKLSDAVTIIPDTEMPIRSVLAMLALCDGLIGVDSFAQHAWIALKRRDAVVLWGATNPRTLGYKSNVNLSNGACQTPHCGRPDLVIEAAHNGTDKCWQCMEGLDCMAFQADTIVANLRESLFHHCFDGHHGR